MPETNEAETQAPQAKIPIALFHLGRIISTSNGLSKLDNADIRGALERHHAGDWGEVEESDRHANDRALQQGGRLFSSYRSGRGVKFWIITEADRSATTVLLP